MFNPYEYETEDFNSFMMDVIYFMENENLSEIEAVNKVRELYGKEVVEKIINTRFIFQEEKTMKYYQLTEDDQASVHDAIYDGLSLHIEKVEEHHITQVFESVAEYIVKLANDWDWGDTEVRDELYLFAKNFRFK